MNNRRTYGITPPDSVLEPTLPELDATRSLLAALHVSRLFESKEAGLRRHTILSRIDTLVQHFVRRVSQYRNMPEQFVREARGKIFPFGSYRLGVHGPRDDMDVLCVAPRHVQRADFFGTFYRMLSEEDEVKDLRGVPDAFVPIIKMRFSGIPLDISFARLALQRIPEDLTLSDDDILSQTDDISSRSLNGTRDAQAILRLIPSQTTFANALRAIKHWAKRRALYGKPVGFFNGIAWTIIVARVCQLYPNATSAVIVAAVFEFCQNHPWPEPVLLKHITPARPNIKVWNPKIDMQDRADRMPVITPAFPSKCVTHTVTESTQIVLIAELERASKIVKRIMQGEAPWSELFEGQEFFRAYRYYVRVVASSTGGDEQQKWAYRVESNIRHFIANMELVEHVSYAHPFPTSFEAVRRCATAKEVLVAQACGRGAVYDDELEEADPADDEWATVVFSTSFWIGIAVEKKRGTGQRKLDLSWPTDEFTKAVKTWDRFDESSMVLVVSYLKVNDIPPEIADRTGQAKIFKKERRQSSRDEGVGEEEDGEVDDDAAPVAEVRTADLIGLESLQIDD